MEALLSLMYFIMFLSLIVVLVWILFSDREKHKYNKISFKDKKEYLCVFYLYGNQDLKSNIGVISKKGDTYLLETEDKVTIHSFSFSENEISFIEVKEKAGASSEDVIVGYNYDVSKSYFSGRGSGTFEKVKGIKISKLYEIKITLTNGMILTFESKKNPRNFFKDIK